MRRTGEKLGAANTRPARGRGRRAGAGAGGPEAARRARMLVLHRGEVVSTDRLIDALWGERPPATAAKTVQVYVSNLRKALGDGVVETRGRGYVLALEARRLDVERFDAARRRGTARRCERRRPPSAAELLARGARALARPAARRPRLRAVRPDRDRAARGGAAGRARGPDRRRPGARPPRGADAASSRRWSPSIRCASGCRAQLMLALYRSGRQAEALERYRAARRALDESSASSRAARSRSSSAAILDQDPALDAPARRAPPAAARRRSRPGRRSRRGAWRSPRAACCSRPPRSARS